VRSSTLGITGITNNINVITASKDVNKRITLKLPERNTTHNKDIMVHVFDNVVTLKGHVDTWHQKLKRTYCMECPGVKQVENDLYVDFIE
jgi:osmotically-inducible protein OsmY